MVGYLVISQVIGSINRTYYRNHNHFTIHRIITVYHSLTLVCFVFVDNIGATYSYFKATRTHRSSLATKPTSGTAGGNKCFNSPISVGTYKHCSAAGILLHGVMTTMGRFQLLHNVSYWHATRPIPTLCHLH